MLDPRLLRQELTETARQLARRTGRNDVCALPYGINTVSLFAYVLLVMLPVKKAAEAAGSPPEQAAQLAFRAGLIAAIGSGVIEAGCRTLIGKRLKQSGMFWSVKGANAIIAARCCLYSGRFEQFWEDNAS